MKYTKTSNYSYNLHIIKTNKFKTVTIQVNFKRKIKKEEITLRNMIVNMLCESNSVYKTERELLIATEELYSLVHRSANYSSGKYNVMSYEITFLNEEYTEPGMLDKSIDFLYNMVFKPNIVEENGEVKFDPEQYSIAYNSLKDRIQSIKEEPSYYARVRMLENMEPDSYVSYRGCGYMEDLDNLDSAKLYKYYESILNSDILDIFVIGNVNVSHIEKVIGEKFKGIRTLKKPSESHFVTLKKHRLVPKTIKEKLNINQSKLVLGFKIDKMTDFELRYVLNVYSYILGGGPDSKLFKNVREKNSLCYYVSSQTYPLYSMLTINSGINKKNFRNALNLIKKEVRNMKKGKFNNDDIIKAKVTYINSLKELEDSPNSLLGLYAGIEYLKSDTLEDRFIKINKVTIQDVVHLASKIHLDTIFLLEGETHEEN